MPSRSPAAEFRRLLIQRTVTVFQRDTVTRVTRVHDNIVRHVYIKRKGKYRANISPILPLTRDRAVAHNQAIVVTKVPRE